MNCQVIESISCFYANLFTVRVWREEKELQHGYSHADIQDAICRECDRNPLTLDQIADFIAKMERVNAVEVKDSEGSGIVVYTQWP